jgi:hypothetical protein
MTTLKSSYLNDSLTPDDPVAPPPVYVAYPRWEGPQYDALRILHPGNKQENVWGAQGYYSPRANGYMDRCVHQVLILEVSCLAGGSVQTMYDGAVLITEAGEERPLLIPADLARWVKVFTDPGDAHDYANRTTAQLWSLQKEWSKRLDDLAALASKEIGSAILRMTLSPPVEKSAVPQMADAATASSGLDMIGGVPLPPGMAEESAAIMRKYLPPEAVQELAALAARYEAASSSPPAPPASP